MTFSTELKTWRTTHALSQKEAAAVLGTEFKTYQNWEYGRTEPMDNPCRECIEERMKKYEPSGDRK